METIRNTGLGDSLLLRRTEAPPAEQPAVTLDGQTTIPSPQEPPRPTRGLQTAEVPSIPLPASPTKTKKKPLVLRDRCTIYLEREVNDQLDMAARIEGRERSEIASDLLRKHLPKYRIEREK
ncbi:MAG: hypothetical protein JSS49_13750 [Planctomycetes bacterium]|nr:hypothetical protein [Planctomycetota bacterium]